MTSFYESRGIEPDVGALFSAHHSLSIRGPLPAETAPCARKIVLRRGKRDPTFVSAHFFSTLSVEGAVMKRNGETNFCRALGRLAGVFANASAGPFSGVCECPHALCRGDPLHSHALLSNLIHPKHRCVYATFASENRLLPLSALCVFDAV